MGPQTGTPLQLTVWFDGDCGFCSRVAKWLEGQPKFVAVHCVAAQTAKENSCPIEVAALLDKITVTASDGAVYRGTNAWLTVLWGLRNYRSWSLRLSRKAWRPWAENLFAMIAGVAKLTKRQRRNLAAKPSR